MSDCICAAAIHPDLVQVWLKLVTITTPSTQVAYEVFPDSAYVLSARLTPAINSAGNVTTDFSAVLVTSMAPLTRGDDEGKIPLYVDAQNRPDYYDARAAVGGSGMFFENGIYAVIDGATAGDDAYLQVCYVPRKQFCPAFPYPEETLLDCWEAAHPGVPIYENFWTFERDVSEEDTGGSGGTGLGAVPLS